MSTRPEHTDSSRIGLSNTELRTERLTLEHSIIEFELGPVGVFARVDHADGRRDYAGPLPDATISALREVGE